MRPPLLTTRAPARLFVARPAGSAVRRGGARRNGRCAGARGFSAHARSRRIAGVVQPRRNGDRRDGNAQQAKDSDRQALAPLGAAGIDDGTATTRLHADKEPVRACAADFGGLVGAFHGLSRSRCPAVGLSWSRPGRFHAARDVRGDMRGAELSGNRLLHQKPPSQSMTYHVWPDGAKGLTRGPNLWITTSLRPTAPYNPSAPTRTFPQHER